MSAGSTAELRAAILEMVSPDQKARRVAAERATDQDAASIAATLADLDADGREDVIATVERIGAALEAAGSGSMAAYALGYRTAEQLAASGALLEDIDRERGHRG